MMLFCFMDCLLRTLSRHATEYKPFACYMDKCVCIVEIVVSPSPRPPPCPSPPSRLVTAGHHLLAYRISELLGVGGQAVLVAWAADKMSGCPTMSDAELKDAITAKLKLAPRPRFAAVAAHAQVPGEREGGGGGEREAGGQAEGRGDRDRKRQMLRMGGQLQIGLGGLSPSSLPSMW